MKLEYNQTIKLKYMKSSFICEYLGAYVKDGFNLIEVRFRGDVYVFDKNTIEIIPYDNPAPLGEDADL